MASPIEDTLGAYQRLIEQGKIRWCSASNLSVKLLQAPLAAAKPRGFRATRFCSRKIISPTVRNLKTASPTPVSARTSASSVGGAADTALTRERDRQRRQGQ
jgi:hypothetical protein